MVRLRPRWRRQARARMWGRKEARSAAALNRAECSGLEGLVGDVLGWPVYHDSEFPCST